MKKSLGLSMLLILLFMAQPARAAAPASSWFDHSHSIFFPPALKKKLTVHQSFSLFWWNFLVLEATDEKRDWQIAAQTCAFLKEHSDGLARVECEQSLKEVQSLLGDWRADYALRYPLPSDSVLRASFDAALAKASLPAGDAELMKLLRNDPLESWHELQLLAEGRLNLPLKRKGGFFYDEATHRIVIPVQMSFSPAETQATVEFQQRLLKGCGDGEGCARWGFIGPHASTLKNEQQIIRDTGIVSRVGGAILAIFGFGLLFSGRGRLFYLVPPVLLAMVVGAGVTIAVFGSIHDLTLSFGAGIVGLALDYGLQAAFNAKSSRIWRSNTFGLLTTIVGLMVVMTSAIPLLRQMMLFSCVGLFTAFGLFYLLLKRHPDYFATRALAATPRVRYFKTGVVLTLMLCGLAGAATLRPSLDMRQFDFQDLRTREISTWLFQHQMARAPLFRIHEGAAALDEAHAEKNWAQGAKIKMENAANYLPPGKVQAAHLESWSPARCKTFRANLTENQEKFFAPFLNDQLCATATPRGLADGTPARSYLAHLVSGSEWITLFFPDSAAQEALVRAQYPDARSLKEIISIFPETFARELSWMAPLSLLLATALLFQYYRRSRFALLALVPFFSGMGLVVVARLIFKFEISFISVMALIMVFGFSIDYGIFATDVGAAGQSENEDGVWTGLSFAAFATVAGFIPMLFCKHPVLLHLGSTLFFGAMGTYLGAIWGIPGLRRFAR